MATFPKGADNPMGTPKGHTVSTLEYTKVILQKNLDTDLSYIYTRSKKLTSISWSWFSDCNYFCYFFGLLFIHCPQVLESIRPGQNYVASDHDLIAFSLKRHKKFSFRLPPHQYLIASSLKRNRKTSFWPPYKYLIAVSLKKRNKNFAFICDTMRKQLGQKNRSLCLLKLPWTQRNSTSYCKILKF